MEVPTTAIAVGLYSCGASTSARPKSRRLILSPREFPSSPIGVICVGPFEIDACQETTREARPPPATRWHGPIVSGTRDSNWLDAYRFPYATTISLPTKR